MGIHIKPRDPMKDLNRILLALTAVLIALAVVIGLSGCTGEPQDVTFNHPAIAISHHRVIGSVEVTTITYPQTLTVHMELLHWQLIRIHKGGWKLMKTETFHAIDLPAIGTTVTWNVATGCKRGWWRGILEGFGINSKGQFQHPPPVEYPLNKHHNKFVRHCD